MGTRTLTLLAVLTFFSAVLAADMVAERPNLGPVRVTQGMIEREELTREEIRDAGLRVFSTPFNKLDGYGDGPMDPGDSMSPGGRPTLQGNGTFLRMNGLDAQSCLECHFMRSAESIPARFAVGGSGGANSNALIRPETIDMLGNPDGEAEFDGRFANPPFVFGSGGVELLGLEMTEELQAIKRRALESPGVEFDLVARDIRFGTIVADGSGELDVSRVEGIDADLVVRPFGRKGEFATVREFAVGAMQFHFGIQPVEIVGEEIDADDDGVVNELLVGELSALHFFGATLERPVAEPLNATARRGMRAFHEIGCADCHSPVLRTRTFKLPLRYPEVPDDPRANVYRKADLTRPPARFRRTPWGGILVPLFSDLKRHDMGEALEESFARVDEQRNREFVTARLWGIADSAPYLHDGRATTLSEAIHYHGGEAIEARDAFIELPDPGKKALLEYLRSLRTPRMAGDGGERHEEPIRGDNAKFDHGGHDPGPAGPDSR